MKAGRPKTSRILVRELKGVMRELSPYGIDLFRHCPFHCSYCFSPEESGWIKSDEFYGDPDIEDDFFYAIRWEIRRGKIDKQVLMSPYTEPYSRGGHTHRRTRATLKAFLKNRVPVAVLTKGGKNVLRDVDVYQDFAEKIKVGMTLVTMSESMSSKLEIYAPSPSDRVEALYKLKQAGVRTQVVIMPALNKEEAGKIIDYTQDITDEYFVSANTESWIRAGRCEAINTLETIVNKLRLTGKRFYVEKGLRERFPEVLLSVEESRRGDFFIYRDDIDGI